LFTLVEIGHIIMSSAGKGISRSLGSGSMLTSQRSYVSDGRMTGMRSWMSSTSSLAAVVMMQKVRMTSPDSGCFQLSQMPAMPNGLPDFSAMA